MMATTDESVNSRRYAGSLSISNPMQVIMGLFRKRDEANAVAANNAALAPPKHEAEQNPGKPTKLATSGADRFHLLTLDEIEKLPDPEWLIKDILPQGAMAVLYGEPGAGKSFLALDWALSIASEMPWFGKNVTSGPTVYIYAEGASGLKARIKAWRQERKAKPDQSQFLPHPLDLLRAEDVTGLIKAIQGMPVRPRLIVIDTLARCFGGGDENAGRDMNAFVAGVDALRNTFLGATVLVVHHSGKDAKRGDRGHSALRGAADTVMRLTKKDVILTLACGKQKDAEEFKPITLRLRRVGLAEGGTSCVIEMLDGTSHSTSIEPKRLKSDQTALDALRDLGEKGATYSDWIEKSGLAASTFKDARNRLMQGGAVIQEGNLYIVAVEGPEAGIGSEQGCPSPA